MGSKNQVSQGQSDIYHSSPWKRVIQANKDGHRSPIKITTPFIDVLVNINSHLFEKGFHHFEGFGSSLTISFWQRLHISRTTSDLFFSICLDQPSAQSFFFLSSHNNKFPGLKVDRRGRVN